MAHYRIGRLLGEGGFGCVYEAWDTQLCRSVAIKCLRLTNAAPPDALMREARRSAGLRHWAFVRIHEVIESAGVQAIVMELIDGCTLREHLRRHGPLGDAALPIARHIAQALDEAHTAGLVHGDLKPGNLMVGIDGRIRILDFGLACETDPLATGSVLPHDLQGTLAYMAPERLLGHPASPASDIYALGILLAEMLSGEPPFAALQGLALAAARLQASVQTCPLPAGTDPALAALVRELSARNPAARPPSMQAVAARIAALAGHAPRLRGARWSTLAAGLGARCAMLALLGVLPPDTHEHEHEPPVIAWSEARQMQAALAALMQLDHGESQRDAMTGFAAVLEHNDRHAGAAAGLAIAQCLRYIDDGRDDVILERARASAQLSLALDDQLALAHVAMAWVAEFTGNAQDARREADTALRLDPGNVLALYGKIRQLIHEQHFGDADRLLDDALARHPHIYLFQAQLGTLRYREGRYREAETAFRRSLQIDPYASMSYASLSQAILRQDRGDEALQVLQRGLQMSPNWALYTNLGTALFARADYLGAFHAFERAVAEPAGNPRNYLLWANLADSQRWLPDQAPAAAASYRRARLLLAPLLARAPDNPVFVSRMALYQAHGGDPVQAADLARRAETLAAQSPDVQFRTALAFELIGQREAALAALARAVTAGLPCNAIESEPDLLSLRRASRYLQLCMEGSHDK